MEIDKIHQAFINLKAVRIHEDIILYVKKIPGRSYFGKNPNFASDEKIAEAEEKSPEKSYQTLLIRAAFSWHVPSDNKENLFTLLSKYAEDIENVFINLDINQLKAFDSNRDPNYVANIPIGIPELSPINMVRDDDGSTIMRVFGKYSDKLTKEEIGECIILEKIKEEIKQQNRDIHVLHI